MPNKEDDNRIKELQAENGKLKKEIEDKNSKLAELEKIKADTGSARELGRLKTKYENLEREKDMVVTEKLAMETEQSIILKENEFLKKMKASAVSKREAVQHLEDKDLAEQARDEALRENQKLKREMDDLQVNGNTAGRLFKRDKGLTELLKRTTRQTYREIYLI